MRISLLLFLMILNFIVTKTLSAADNPPAYLNGDNLIARIEVEILRGGAVGVTGTFYAIETDGTWTSGTTVNQNKTMHNKGKLSAQQISQLTNTLVTQDLANLRSDGRPYVNPEMIQISFGKNVCTLIPHSENLPPATNKSIQDRYNSILHSIIDLCKSK